MHSTFYRRTQSGVALAVALILLVVLTLLALSGVRLSTMELRMALADEIRVSAFEQAQSAVDSTIRLFANTPVLAPGVVICARSNGLRAPAGCEQRVTLPSNYHDERDANTMNVVIQRIPPQNAEPPVGTGFSINLFDAAFLQVEGHYDENATGRGMAQVNEGVAVVYGSSPDQKYDSNPNAFDGADPTPPPPPPPPPDECAPDSEGNPTC